MGPPSRPRLPKSGDVASKLAADVASKTIMKTTFIIIHYLLNGAHIYNLTISYTHIKLSTCHCIKSFLRCNAKIVSIKWLKIWPAKCWVTVV